MKIGILTYHRAENFGAVLQAYALSSYLRSEKHDVEVIDYRSKNIERRYEIFSPGILLSRKNIYLSIKEYIGRFSNIADRRTKKRKFEEFRKNLPLSKPVRARREIGTYDIIITGSDQVWNFHINKGDENVYLLNFGSESLMRVSYAASSERNGLSRIPESQLREAFDRFDKISVREQFLKDIVGKLTNKKVSVCVDPVFLLSASEYEDVCMKPRERKYILVFHMTYSRELVEFASKLAMNKGLRLIECFGGFAAHQKSADSICNWGPQELLGLIANAEVVFTTSFHGLAFSLILHRNVWLINKGDNCRQHSLLHLAGLDHRMLKTFDQYNEQPIDFDSVDSKLAPVIKESKDFLRF
ncbi:polysaccharide pyruvyl transferase family protein [uncultured Duncaniella sp.]|uniref:polysaccharide pyruvyl transferase family protein n=1 Tax=uncultured Duncaniella sp. TaxID=2768039 RepID=UPI00267523A6|nr:polysaccharide pyruvyl transferase family protein [uncultured Duncaniella sp.]